MPIRAGVVGLGQSGWELHCLPISKMQGMELSAVCDLSEKRCKEAEKVFAVKTYREYSELLKDKEITLVVIASPTLYHHEMAMDALKMGKHVVVEKPMCLYTGEANEMIETARAGNLVLTVFHIRRLYADYLTIRKIIEDNWLGELISFEVRMCGFSPEKTVNPDWKDWRRKRELGGGLLYDFGSHMVDQILQIVNNPLKNVFCMMRNVFTAEVEDYIKGFLQFYNGMMAQFEANSASRILLPKWYIQGRHGTLWGEPDNNWGKITVRMKKEGKEVEVYPKRVAEGGVTEAPQKFYENLHDVLNERAELLVKPEECLEVIKVLNACQKSSQDGTAVSLL